MATAKRQASEQGALAIRLFGHTEMNLEGVPFKFATPRKSLQVLAYLLLHRSAPVTREDPRVRALPRRRRERCPHQAAFDACRHVEDFARAPRSLRLGRRRERDVEW